MTEPASVATVGAIGSLGAVSIVCANLGLLGLYVLLDLTLFQLVLVYWWEILWIGLFSGLKLLVASLFGNPFDNRWIHFSRGASLFVSLFAMAKSAGLFFALLVFTGVGLLAGREAITGVPGADFAEAQLGLVLRCSLIFFVGHGLSFVVNFLLLGEFRRARFATLLWLPFRRSVALVGAVAILLGAIALVPGLLTESAFAAILIAAKLCGDYWLHRRERESLNNR